MVRRPVVKQSVDRVLLTTILFLVGFGVIMVYDASVVYSLNVFGGSHLFLFSQFFWAVLGISFLGFLSHMDIGFLEKASPYVYLLSLFFLFAVLLPTSFSPEIYGARRWFYINPSPLPKIPFLGRVGFQPSDFAKFAYVIYGSFILNRKDIPKKEILKKFILISALPFLLIIKEPDFGTSLVFLGMGALMFFVSNQPLIYFLIGGPVAFLAGTLFVFSSPYRKERLLTFLRPAESSSLGSGYHIQQILIALGSGGLFGLGLGQSRQKYSYLPEVTADSIFAVIGEEFGFVGSTLLILVFSFIIFRSFSIIQRLPSTKLKTLAVGSLSFFALQSFMNIAAMLNVIPLTGIPLPLISYGGSAMVFGLGSLGLLLNTTRYARKD